MSASRGPHKRSAGAPATKARAGAQVTRGVLELDRFTTADLARWKSLSGTLDRLHSYLHFGLAEQRNALRGELLAALRDVRCEPFGFDGWTRILPYRYCLSPLSAAGSLNGVGGRFNVGRDIARDISPRWPALYLAEDFDTAFREKYGHARAHRTGTLTPADLALVRSDSFLSVAVSGRIERPFDLTQLDALGPFCAVLAKCKMPREARDALRRLKIPSRNLTLVKTPTQLRKVVMAHNWRQWPAQFEIPAHGQVFASLLVAAGFEAAIYPSSQSRKRCLAIFPGNLGSKATFVELAAGYPENVSYPRLDMDSAAALGGLPDYP